jgi:hypothetical protein
VYCQCTITRLERQNILQNKSNQVFHESESQIYSAPRARHLNLSEMPIQQIGSLTYLTESLYNIPASINVLARLFKCPWSHVQSAPAHGLDEPATENNIVDWVWQSAKQDIPVMKGHGINCYITQFWVVLPSHHSLNCEIFQPRPRAQQLDLNVFSYALWPSRTLWRNRRFIDGKWFRICHPECNLSAY